MDHANQQVAGCSNGLLKVRSITLDNFNNMYTRDKA